MLDLIRQRAQSWVVRIIFGIIILVFVLYFGTGTMRRAGKSNAVAYVGEHPISGQEFDAAAKRAYDNLRRQNPNMSREDLKRIRFREQVLNQMINTVLLEQEAARLGLVVTPDEVRSAIADVPAFQTDKRFNADRYKAVLREVQSSPGEFEADMARQILVDKVRRTLNLAVTVAEPEAKTAFDFAREQLRLDTLLFGWEEFSGAVKPSEDEIKEFYSANQERFKVPARMNLETVAVSPKVLAKPGDVSDAEVAQYYAAHEKSFAQPEAVKLRHILVRVDEDAPAAEADKAREQVLKLRLRLDKGEDFAVVARESDDPSASQGGELGWIPRGTTVQAFEEAAFALKPGQVSMPVRSPFGWHLIKCEDKRAEGVKSLAEARADIRAMLAEEHAASKVAEVLDEALERTLAGEALGKVAGDLHLTVNTTGLAPAQTIIQALSLKPEVAEKLESLAVGQTLDAPLAVSDGYLLVRKAEAQPAEIKALDEVKPAVTEAVKRQAAMKLAREKAGAVLAEIAAPGAAGAGLLKYKDRLKTTEPVGRQGFIKGLGLNPNLVEDAYNAAEGAWLGQAYPVQNGFVLVRLKERIPPTAAEWSAEKETWLTGLRQAKERELFSAYLSDLRARAKVNVLVDLSSQE